MRFIIADRPIMRTPQRQILPGSKLPHPANLSLPQLAGKPADNSPNFLMRDSEFEFIRGLVYRRSRINLTADKRALVSARLGQRLRANRLENLSEYCQLLQSPEAPEELAHLIDVISTNHTFFFREAV